ncbi:MAG: endonuclease/exonuclease/phosphatase family protein [Microbacteriaceae bacterium]
MTTGVLIGPRSAPELHVMSFNIRRRMPHFGKPKPDTWSFRSPAMHRLLADEQPTILGVQEAMPDQTDFVARALGSRYRWIGYGRNFNRRGERCPIFYDADRLKLTEWTQWMLSDTPAIAGSRTWGNTVPRIVLSARFTDRATGIPLHVLNTHLDHRSRNSRVEAARMLARILRADDVAALLTGDFNTSIGTEPYNQLIADGAIDTWDAAHERLTEEWGTFPNYHQPRLGLKRIDWILANSGVTVRSVGINRARWRGIAASDHLPVQAVVTLKEPS